MRRRRFTLTTTQQTRRSGPLERLLSRGGARAEAHEHDAYAALLEAYGLRSASRLERLTPSLRLRLYATILDEGDGTLAPPTTYARRAGDDVAYADRLRRAAHVLGESYLARVDGCAYVAYRPLLNEMAGRSEWVQEGMLDHLVELLEPGRVSQRWLKRES